MNNTDAAEQEIEILSSIESSKNIRQRDLSRELGLSLGMINSIVKRLAKKGLLIVKKINNKTIQYVISAQGMQAITERSYRYFKRTLKNVVIYKENIEALIAGIHNDGYLTVLLIGKSDIDFIIEHFCNKYGLIFKRGTAVEEAKDSFFLFSEIFETESGFVNENAQSVYLSEVLIKL